MSLNKITLSGNLGADAELRYTKSGNPVVSFSLAVNERTPNGDGTWGEYTNWPDCVMFGKRAEGRPRGLPIRRKRFARGESLKLTAKAEAERRKGRRSHDGDRSVDGRRAVNHEEVLGKSVNTCMRAIIERWFPDAVLQSQGRTPKFHWKSKR